MKLNKVPSLQNASYISKGVVPIQIQGLKSIRMSIPTANSFSPIFMKGLSSILTCRAILMDYLSAKIAKSIPHK